MTVEKIGETPKFLNEEKMFSVIGYTPTFRPECRKPEDQKNQKKIYWYYGTCFLFLA